MCGRYALALRPSQIRQMLQDDDMPVDDAPADEGDGAPRQSYNFAPGYHGIVYRADVPGWGRASTSHANTDTNASADDRDADHHHQLPTEEQDAPPQETHYKLQSMKWGLIPSWTKRNPDYGAMLKTINCRDDSLASPGGMWASMKGRKRCVVVAQGFYEWLKKGSNKIPHYVKRKDGKLMYFAGLWDCVRYEGEEGEHYTYTVITTDSNKQLKFLHDRMPVILEPGTEAMLRWLDPGRKEWGKELQAVLRPFEGELEVYPVSQEVGKVGNNSPSFVIPVASRENKGNIANFFAKGAEKKKAERVGGDEVEVEKESGKTEMKTVEEVGRDADDGGMGMPKKGVKREADSSPVKGAPPAKKGPSNKGASPIKEKPEARGKISATSNTGRSPAKARVKAEGSQKITKFFGNSA
ncbi:DUF159-domain-containing protein [Parathielavia appendiculata]|uniref:DUF159-domain-containing protein n=1 Tax=Parathielavia appendiculata TaxID=2587402 RepID=A0AAN6U5A6_9PEZI|nr:DUF159-domain-containing protein [Parathielavia appendiculata]